MSISKRALRILMLLSPSFVIPMFGQAPLDESTVAAAIRAGETRKNAPFVSSCIATSFSMLRSSPGSAEVFTTTTAGYIALLADLGRKVYRPITPADIGPDLRIPMIHVVIGNVRAMGVKQVILKSKTSPEAFVAPERVVDGSGLDELRVIQRGTMGGLFARFAYEGVRSLPSGDIDVVLLSGDLTEYRCKIGRSDRAKLFPGSAEGPSAQTSTVRGSYVE